jgi:outer membrane murein-binding lipoprotein Lpp
MAAKTTDIKEMEAKLEQLATKIKEVDAKVHRKHSEIKSHIEEVETLQAKHKTAREMLDQCEKATHEEWTTLKSGYEELLKDIQAVLSKIASSY